MSNTLISDAALQILKTRYLDKDESVDGMFRRVSLGDANAYRLMSQLKALPNSPTIFNAGLNNGCTMSACFTFMLQDSMFGPSSIVDTRNKAIAVAKAGGGVGYNVSNIRRKNAIIKSVHRKACGPVAVIRDLNAVDKLITQGGKRALAQMGVLAVEHEDIREFIHMKDDAPEELSSFNISVNWSDKWLTHAFGSMDNRSDPHWRPNEPYQLWMEQCQSAWKTGCPGMFFPDVINRFNENKHLGLVLTPNPCGEAPNRDNEACSLGSMSIARYVDLRTRRFLRDEFLHDSRIFFRYLNHVFDHNTWPHPEITKATQLTRRLGQGIMGWADFLALQGMHYDDPASRAYAESIWKDHDEVIKDESRKIASEKGPYPGYDPDKTQGECRRNETCSSIAPTGTIAEIADVWGSIEPHLFIDAERMMMEGIKLATGVKGWVRDNLDGFVPKIASQVSVEDHILMQAAFQKHTDLAVSKTINLPESATVEDVSKAYRLMYESGCKGGTIFRDNCRKDQVIRKKEKKSVYLADDGVYLVNTPNEEAEQLTVLKEIESELGSITATKVMTEQGMAVINVRRNLPKTRNSVTHKFSIDGHKGYVTVGLYDDGSPGEIFLKMNKAGTTISGMLDSWAMMASVSLQYHVPLASIVRLYAGTRYEPAGFTDDPAIPSCTSVHDYIVRWLELRFLKKDAKADESVVMSGQMCPDCGIETVRQGGCLVCIRPACGYSRC
jgi:ribonucleoside-diphosphate reductase alpha chain